MKTSTNPRALEFIIQGKEARSAAQEIKRRIKDCATLKVVSVWERQVIVSCNAVDPDYEIAGYYSRRCSVDDLADDIVAARRALAGRARRMAA